MAQLIDVEIVIDGTAGSDDEVFIPKCMKCGTVASKRLLNEHGDHIGFFCNDHAQAAYEEQQTEEDEAKHEVQS